MNNETLNQLQAACDAIGKPKHHEGTACNTVYPLGLCPRCGEPIELSLTNGGKLSPSRTLRASHIFSGDVRCELPATNALIAGKSGSEKGDFFALRHDKETVASLSPAMQEEILARIWGPNYPK